MAIISMFTYIRLQNFDKLISITNLIEHILTYTKVVITNKIFHHQNFSFTWFLTIHFKRYNYHNYNLWEPEI